jgi:hypothetical protein
MTHEELEQDPLIEALGWVDSYVRYLRDLDMPRELVARRGRQLRVMATVCVQQTGHGLEEIAAPEAGKSPSWPGGNPMGRLGEAFKLLDDVGLEEGEPAWCTHGNVRVCMDSLRAFLAWRHRGEPEGPTAERLAELEQLRRHGGAKLPVSDDVRKLLAAPGRETTAERTDTVAMTLAAHEGLSAEDLCALRVGDVDLDGGRLRVHPAPPEVVEPDGGTDEGTDHEAGTEGAEGVSLAPVRSVPLDDPWVRLLGPLVEGEAPERPLLRNRSGNGLTPRQLQRRIAQHVVALGDELSEPLTLERLRDYAGYQMLVGGATLEEVARRLGYTRTSWARRRFGGEVWAYLADREDAWFSLEAAAEVEEIEVDELRRWADSGMRHARDGERILVRKTDVREFMRRPRPPRPPLTDEEKAEITKRIIPHPLFDALESGGGGAAGETLEDALADVVRSPASSAPDSYAELATEVSAALGPALAALWRVRESMPRDEDGPERVAAVFGMRWPELHEVDASFTGLRNLLWGTNRRLNMDDLVARTARDMDVGSWARPATAMMYQGPRGLMRVCEVLCSERDAAALFLLVDRYTEELRFAVAAARDYYGISQDALRTKGPACLLHAFLLAVHMADPAIPLDPRGPIATHEELMLEFVPRWLGNLLWRAGAVPAGPPGAFGRAPRITHLADDGFIQAFRERWIELRRYRRGRWSYRVIPALAMEDLARYRRLTFGKGEADGVLCDVLNYVLYLSKLPDDRPLLALIHSSRNYAWCVYGLHMPVVEQEYARTILNLKKQTGRPPRNLVGLVPDGMVSEIRDLCLAAVKSFDYSKGGTVTGGAADRTTGTAFVTYLRRRVRRYFADLSTKLRADVMGAVPTAPEVLAEQVVDPGETPDGGLFQIPLRIDEASTDPSAVLDLVIGPDGQRYVTTWWAAQLSGRSQRWVQQHARELGARRAAEVFATRGDAVAWGLKEDHYLFPYDGELADRIRGFRPPQTPDRSSG